MAFQQSGAVLPSSGVTTLESRALALWPRLDRSALRRCGNDPGRIASLISRRTSLPPESIKQILVMTIVSYEEGETWFG